MEFFLSKINFEIQKSVLTSDDHLKALLTDNILLYGLEI